MRRNNFFLFFIYLVGSENILKNSRNHHSNQNLSYIHNIKITQSYNFKTQINQNITKTEGGVGLNNARVFVTGWGECVMQRERFAMGLCWGVCDMEGWWFIFTKLYKMFPYINLCLACFVLDMRDFNTMIQYLIHIQTYHNKYMNVI